VLDFLASNSLAVVTSGGQVDCASAIGVTAAIVAALKTTAKSFLIVRVPSRS
jgi:hypothetical protein